MKTLKIIATIIAIAPYIFTMIYGVEDNGPALFGIWTPLAVLTVWWMWIYNRSKS
jgi:hypothetical protein